MIVIVHDSDLHYTSRKPRNIKRLHPNLIIDTRADIVIVTGDLTENGHDGKYLNFILFKLRYGGSENQFKKFKEDYVQPIEAAGKEVFLCAGNHDRGEKFWNIFPHRPVRKYVQRRHGANTYTFERQGLRFLVMDEYPRKLKWLRKQLERHADRPFIIAFHFNLEGAYSNWWSNKAKQKFYDCVKDYRILALLVGHNHVSKVTEWQGIRVIASAKNFGLIYYNPEAEIIENISFARIDMR